MNLEQLIKLENLHLIDSLINLKDMYVDFSKVQDNYIYKKPKFEKLYKNTTIYKGISSLYQDNCYVFVDNELHIIITKDFEVFTPEQYIDTLKITR